MDRTKDNIQQDERFITILDKTNGFKRSYLLLEYEEYEYEYEKEYEYEQHVNEIRYNPIKRRIDRYGQRRRREKKNKKKIGIARKER